MRHLYLLLVCGLLACTPARGARTTPVHPTALIDMLDTAIVLEMGNPLESEAYLDVIDVAVADRANRWSLAAVAAALDALVWRDVHGLGPGVSHAIVHRSIGGLTTTTARLRRAWRRAEGAPLVRGMIAITLHQLALRVGADKAAPKWRRRAGCVSPVTLIGPIGFPPLASLSHESPINGALKPSYPGIPPFASEAKPESVYGDACAININDVSAARGQRAIVVDVHNPIPQTMSVILTTSSAAVVEVGGQRVLERAFDAGGGMTTRFGQASAEAGVFRVVLRVAQNQDGQRVVLQVLDEKGRSMRSIAPRPGALADAKVSATKQIDVVPSDLRPSLLTLAAAALLATGDSRRAAQMLEGELAPRPVDAPAYVDMLRVRAMESARLVPRNQLMMQVQSAAERAFERCNGCWEPRLAVARLAQERKGQRVGVYARFDVLGVSANDLGWTTELGPMELLSVALGASSAGLRDVARNAFEALSKQIPGSMLVADLDWSLHRRHGDDRIKASCAGGTNRSTTRCFQAHIARSDENAAMQELERLRRLRGSPAILRDLELRQLLSDGRFDDAMRIYHALPPARRTLALLGAAPSDGSAAEAFAADMRYASDAPFAFEPLARLLGVVDDDSVRFDREGAQLVAQDRKSAFLPGAGTAVLRRVERYDLSADGVLHFVIYDLRRVSGTIDVASGTWIGRPVIDGRMSSRMLRRRIYKQDGRVIDPDPSARGRQGSTDLSQLQAGDYVEGLSVGWALPNDSGQMVVDTPDILPQRTSVRRGELTFTRPASIKLSLWSHPLLGPAVTSTKDQLVSSTWKLSDQRPRRLEQGVPPLEARVGFSFGSDSYERIAKALDDRYRSLDEDDPFVDRWVREAVGDEQQPSARVAKLVAATGKAIVRGDASALGDFVASLGGGAQRETARWIIEKGTGSRTWVVHRGLRALGLESEIVVSETRPFSAAPGFPPRPGRFTHPLVRVTVEGKPIWIDADVAGPPLPPGRVSPELRGRRALLSNGDIITVESDADDDVDLVDVNLKLDAAGNASGTFSVVMHGRPAQRLARALEVVVGSPRDEMLRNVVLGWLPWADVKSVTLSSDAGAWQLSLSAEIEITNFARPESRTTKVMSLPGFTPIHVVHPRPRAMTLAARFMGVAQRTTSLAINQPLLYRVRRRIELPPGAKVLRVPSGLALKAARIEASRTTNQEAQVIEDEFRLNLPVGSVQPDEYAAFAQKVQQVDDAFLHGTRIELP
jgi:hypothetical protein